MEHFHLFLSNSGSCSLSRITFEGKVALTQMLTDKSTYELRRKQRAWEHSLLVINIMGDFLQSLDNGFLILKDLCNYPSPLWNAVHN